MHVTVTGAGSKAGAAILRRLAADGHATRGTLHIGSDPAPPAAGADLLEVDYLRPATLTRAFAGAHGAVLITPAHHDMPTMVENLVAAAVRARVERVVLLSFLHAGSGVGGPLLAWHAEAERIVRRAGLASTCLRPNYYMQNFLAVRRPTSSLGAGSVSYVDARDVGDVVAAVLPSTAHVGTTCSLTGPRALTMREVGELVEEAGAIPSELGWEDLCAPFRRSAHPQLVQALCEFWLAADEDAFATVTGDVRRLTGRSPRDFTDFARRALDRRRTGTALFAD